VWAGLIRLLCDTVYYKRGRCEGEFMAMVILGYVVCSYLVHVSAYVSPGFAPTPLKAALEITDEPRRLRPVSNDE
jgi:hypothetical protein